MLKISPSMENYRSKEMSMVKNNQKNVSFGMPALSFAKMIPKPDFWLQHRLDRLVLDLGENSPNSYNIYLEYLPNKALGALAFNIMERSRIPYTRRNLEHLKEYSIYKAQQPQYTKEYIFKAIKEDGVFKAIPKTIMKFSNPKYSHELASNQASFLGGLYVRTLLGVGFPTAEKILKEPLELIISHHDNYLRDFSVYFNNWANKR